ncbi:MAG: HAD hydrolase-like protein [Oscillospiraceae bacterium]|nr:HAD hydrolase-like protein [Oscillospiraceae bacterium]
MGFKLKKNGISLAVVSNNSRERVEKFCTPLGIDFYWKSGKPRRRTILRAMEKLGGTKKTTALVGDKMITDILGAKRSGILAIKVPPLGKRRLFE